MSNYYYNERKGRYEPVSEAPLGIVPREKRDRRVYTPEDYANQAEDQFSEHFDEAEIERRFQPESKPANTQTSSIADAVRSATNSLGMGGSIPSSFGKQSQSYSGGQTTSSSSGQATTQKGKSAFGLIFVLFWIIFFAVKECASN